MQYEQPLTIKQFAEAININIQIARQMARSEAFKRHKIAVDVACADILPKYKRSTGRRNKKMRIYLSRYMAAVEKGLLRP